MIRIRPYEDSDKEQVISLWQTCKLTRPWNDPNKDLDRKKGVGNELLLFWKPKTKL